MNHSVQVPAQPVWCQHWLLSGVLLIRDREASERQQALRERQEREENVRLSRNRLDLHLPSAIKRLPQSAAHLSEKYMQ